MWLYILIFFDASGIPILIPNIMHFILKIKNCKIMFRIMKNMLVAVENFQLVRYVVFVYWRTAGGI